MKTVNDNYGHEMGDKYLLSVVRVLEGIRGDGDFLFRQAQHQLEETGRSQNYPFHMSFSYGIATPEDGDEVSDLIHTSDTRMYQIRQQQGHNCSAFCFSWVK